MPKYKLIGERRMNKKVVPLISLCLLLLAVYSTTAAAVEIPNQQHFILESIGDAETVDYAWAYDTASASMIFNVYDTLIFFERESVSDYIPSIAMEWAINQPPDAAAPEGTDSTWYFKIRTDAPWQDPAYGTVTTEDVEYSFERAMVMDRTGGPVWMINEPLIGNGWPDKSGWAEAPGNPIDMAVQHNDTHVWLNLAMPYPPFMQILSQSWASIVCKAWCSAIENEWDGDWSDWKSYEDPGLSPMDAAGNIMMGTGPYMLDYWTHGVEYSIVRFEDYWGGWPAPHCSRYLDRVTEKVVYEWGTRFADLMAGSADTVYVPTAHLPEVIENWPTGWDDAQKRRVDEYGNAEYYAEGIRCLPGIPTLAADAFFFNLDINPATAYVGTGSFPGGIPLNFFSDRRIRQAFAYSFDYDEFLEAMFWGEAEQPASCVKRGILYHNPANPKYSLDPYAAAALFQEASADSESPAYQVWDLGFTMTITYNTGNVPRETTAMMFKENVEALFELGPDGIADTDDEAPGTASISTLAVPWPTYLGELYGIPVFKSLMPLFIIGWLADYPDPHNWVTPFMHTYGDFTGFQSYSNATVDALIDEGIRTPDSDPRRKEIYETLQLMYFQDAPSVGTSQAFGRHWERDWYQGWYFNPIYPGLYVRDVWKGLNGDINTASISDNVVDILDDGVVSAHWHPGPPVGPLGYDPIADIFPELQYRDLPLVWDAEFEQWIQHPSNGAVDIFDSALISAHWLESA